MKNKYFWILILFISVFVLWAGSGFYMYHNLDSWGDRGTAGDMFGAINSLFSGLALAGVIIAIFLQRYDLKLTKEEMRRTADAQEKSEISFQKQSEALLISAKLSAYTSLLKVNDDETAGLDDYVNGGPESDREKLKEKSTLYKEKEDLIKKLRELVKGLNGY